MTPKPYQPFVSEDAKMQEFTMRAVLLGLVLTVVLGAANAYLGLRAGQTIARRLLVHSRSLLCNSISLQYCWSVTIIPPA